MRARARRVDAEIAPVDGDGRRVAQDVAAHAASADGLEARYGPRGPGRLEKQNFDAAKPTVRRSARRSQGLRALVDREAARELAALLRVVDAVVRGALVVLGPRRLAPDAPLRVADDAVAHAYEKNLPLERDPRSRALKNTFQNKDAAADARARGASPCR